MAPTKAAVAAPALLIEFPPELRYMIYDFILEADEPVHVNQKTTNTKGWPTERFFKSTEGIILACKQLHREFLAVVEKAALDPASCKVVQAVISHNGNDNIAGLLQFICSLSAQQKQVINKKLELRVFHAGSASFFTTDSRIVSWFRCCERASVTASYAVDGPYFESSRGGLDYLLSAIRVKPRPEAAKLYLVVLESHLAETQSRWQEVVAEMGWADAHLTKGGGSEARKAQLQSRLRALRAQPDERHAYEAVLQARRLMAE